MKNMKKGKLKAAASKDTKPGTSGSNKSSPVSKSSYSKSPSKGRRTRGN